MKSLGDWLHSNNLKFGIYTAHSNRSCLGHTGSEGYEYMSCLGHTGSEGYEYMDA